MRETTAMHNGASWARTMERERYYRSSVRSRGSSSTSDIAARQKIIDCCRKLVAFMCTQVGVGGLVVGYTVVGAFTFQYIETIEENPALEKVNRTRSRYAYILWEIANEQNVFNETAFKQNVSGALKRYQDEMVVFMKKGYDGRTVQDMWSIPAALMFSLSIITMIGYGNMVPRTPWGKGVTVLYAVFGIPLYILYFMNMGEVLAGTFRWIYTWLYECSTERDEDEPPRRVIVPSSASLWVIGGYIATGAIMFAQWEQWSYLDSTYFCVTSLCKIGLGDFVPGANINDFKVGSQTKLVVNFVYMLVGLGLVAMCYNLMREEIKIKVKEMKEDMGQCLEDTKMRFISCANKCRS
ncbi:PREDICTED: potassium channel subfamily K member 15 [Nicrophorus vespilloides]|uniref:Potassium channel subfamily K member 15 n=1 Tax=Nicrophorus vespilloides TaxID=110193 RepID=A0ABM1MWZ2_NICVS|nr:PREDICTED: potassium channel subfamily K member 15 [Nicrophorus vespilloides]